MAKKLAPLPRVTSKTITVGALLGKIKRLILEEPLRIDMSMWVSKFMGDVIQKHTDAAPACGTVGCMAGWGAILLRPDRTPAATIADNAQGVMTNAVGYDMRGIRVVGNLFNAHNVYGENAMPEPGTHEHAEFVANRIDTYLSRHPEIVSRKIVVADVQKALRA